jgi:hypothetical protein
MLEKKRRDVLFVTIYIEKVIPIDNKAGLLRRDDRTMSKC